MFTLRRRSGGVKRPERCGEVVTQNVAKRRGKRRATIALARRIGVILHRMWQDGTEFRFKRIETAAA